MHLGIEQNSGVVFEGLHSPELPIQPKPVVSQCQIAHYGADQPRVPDGLIRDPMSWLFREDSFDPVTRVRRGRIYQPYGNSQPSGVNVPREPSPDYLARDAHSTTHRSLVMNRYVACTELFNADQNSHGKTLVIGHGGATSLWTIVQVESLISGDVLVTLKAKTAFGVIPELKDDALPEEAKKPVRQAIERAVNSAFRETAVSVVDQCRNAMTVVIAHYLASQGEPANVLKKELKPLGDILMAKEKAVCGSAALIVARMHSRGKGNEQFDKALREPIDEDGEFAVHALGLVMREVGWAA